MPAARRRIGLPVRLLVAQLVVFAVGIAALVVVALAVGPPLFADHLRRALVVVSPEVSTHAEDAFATAAGLAIGAGALACLVAAAAVSVFLTRRLTRPVLAMRAAAGRLADGDYEARMPALGLGPELDALGDSFNSMAAVLHDTERGRQRLPSDVPHELRTPLATIDAYLDALADGVRSPDQDTWGILADQTTRLRRLTEDLALLSRAEEHQLVLRRAPTAANNPVIAAVTAARPGYAARGVELVTYLAVGLPELNVDADRVSQVVDNLLSNALRHTPSGGRVTVTTDRATRPAGPAVRVSVTDTGEGIAAEQLPHVFDRFYRADAARDRAHGGSGLGLAIARALTGALGGTLTASSGGPGAGATFVVTLPLTPT